MNKTVYLRDEEVPVWERARQLSGDKLSPVIIAALKAFVVEKEAGVKGFERIEVAYSDADVGGLLRRKAFYGRWIFPYEQPHADWDSNGNVQYLCALALTAKGAVVTCSWSEDEEGQTNKRFRVFTSFEQAAAERDINEAVCAAIKEIGVPIEELDI